MGNKLHLQAVRNRSRFNWQPYHLTSMNIGSPQCHFARFLYPGDNISKFHISAMLRTQPLKFPSYIRASHKMMSCFVPAYQVDEYAEYAFTGTKLVGNVETTPIKVSTKDFIERIFKGDPTTYTTFGYNNTLFTKVNTPTSRWDYNFYYQPNDTTTVFLKLNARGRRFYKVLKNIGYELFDFTHQANQFDDMPYLSLYPLLCYTKAVNDFYMPQQYKNINSFTNYLENIKHRRKYFKTDGDLTTSEMEVDPVYLIVKQLADTTALYNSDYFTTAWNMPNQVIPTIGTYHPHEETDVPYHYNKATSLYVNANENNTLMPLTEYEGTALVTQRGLDYLRAFDKWVRRNNFVGQSTVNRVLTAFGIKPEQVRSHDTDIIRCQTIPISIGDVTSFADTSELTTSKGSQLGAYCGKAFSQGDFNFNYHSSDYGMIFVFSHIAVDPLYKNGIRHENFATSSYDFYQKEFDALQATPISKRELNNGTNYMPEMPYIASTRGVFGWQPNYEWLRSHLDSASGDFVTSKSYSGWLATKPDNFDGIDAQDNGILSYAINPYKQLFQDENDDFDKFICSFVSDIDIVRPIMSSSEATGLEQGDTTVEKFGN